jgi:hypothetical protein
MNGMKRLHNVFPQPPERFSARVAQTLENIENSQQTEIKEVFIMKRTPFKAMKIAAVAAAAALVLTAGAIGVGAATGWNYSGIFSSLFGGGDLGNLGVSEMPSVTNMRNNSDNLELEVLGIAGDDQMLHMVVKFIPKNGYVIDVNDEFGVLHGYSLTMRNFTPDEREFPGASSWGGGGSPQVIEQLECGSVIVSVGISFSTFSDDGISGGWVKGVAAMELYTIEGRLDRLDSIMSFNVAVDYDFSTIRTVEVGKSVTFGDSEGFLRDIKITPISVRYTIELSGITGDYPGFFSGWGGDGEITSVTLSSGEVIVSSDSASGGGGFYDENGDGFMTISLNFAIPFDVDDVVAVTIGGIEFAVE